jgi:hypothetical protein
MLRNLLARVMFWLFPSGEDPRLKDYPAHDYPYEL